MEKWFHRELIPLLAIYIMEKWFHKEQVALLAIYVMEKWFHREPVPLLAIYLFVQNLSHSMTKPVFSRLKSVCSTSEASWSLEILDVTNIGIIYATSNEGTDQTAVVQADLHLCCLNAYGIRQVFSWCGSFIVSHFLHFLLVPEFGCDLWLRYSLEIFSLFFIFCFGFYSPSRLFHSFWAKSIIRWGENGRSLRKTTWPPASRTWLVSRDPS